MNIIRLIVRRLTKWAWDEVKNPSNDKRVLKFLDKYCMGFKVKNEAGQYRAYYRCDNGIYDAVLTVIEEDSEHLKVEKKV